MDTDGNLAALRIFRGAQLLRNLLICYQNDPVNITNSNPSQTINGLWHRSPDACDKYLQSPPLVGGRSPYCGALHHACSERYPWQKDQRLTPSLSGCAHQVKALSLHMSNVTELDFLHGCVCPASKQNTWLPTSVHTESGSLTGTKSDSDGMRWHRLLSSITFLLKAIWMTHC